MRRRSSPSPTPSGLERFSLVGHHTGGIIAVEVAGRHPERIDKLVLSGTTCPDGEGRRRGWPSIDGVVPNDDGSHLIELYQKRASYYPSDRPDLLHRLVLDCLRVGLDRVEEGHRRGELRSRSRYRSRV